jgi:CHASE1-domain containing sensor protein
MSSPRSAKADAEPSAKAETASIANSFLRFADLGEDMDTLAENLQVVQKTSDAGELKAALNKTKADAEPSAKAETASIANSFLRIAHFLFII